MGESNKQKKRSAYSTVGAEVVKNDDFDDHEYETSSSSSSSSSSTWTKGEVQPAEYRDVPYAVIFIINLLFTLSIATFKGHQGYIHAVEYITSSSPYYDDTSNAATPFEDDFMAEEEEGKESGDYYGEGDGGLEDDDEIFDDTIDEEIEELIEIEELLDDDEEIEEIEEEIEDEEILEEMIEIEEIMDDDVDMEEMEEEIMEEIEIEEEEAGVVDDDTGTTDTTTPDYLDGEEDFVDSLIGDAIKEAVEDEIEVAEEGGEGDRLDDQLEEEIEEGVAAGLTEDQIEASITEEIEDEDANVAWDNVKSETSSEEKESLEEDDYIKEIIGEEIEEIEEGGTGSLLDDEIEEDIEIGLAMGETEEEIEEIIEEEINQVDAEDDDEEEEDDIFFEQDDGDDHDDDNDGDDYYRRHLEEEWEEEMIEEETDIILSSLWFPIFVSTITGLFFTGGAMKLLQHFPQESLKTSLLLNVVVLVLAALFTAINNDADYATDDGDDSSAVVAFVYILFALLVGWYAKNVWHMIPYAASCMNAGVIACEANKGVFLYSFMAPWIFIIVLAVQMIASIGLLDMGGVFEADNDGGSACTGFVFIWLLFSIYWASQVVKNISTVTVSGTVGTWWFTPRQANSFLSDAVIDSLKRSVTFSFGSICLGSLLTAILQIAVDNLRSMRRQPRLGVFFCVIACLLQYLEHLLEYFNKWAYVYVGLYGYKYMDAGKMVMSLFKSRGWTAIISHNLVGRCLGLMIFSIGMITLLVDTILIEMILDSSKDYKNIYAGLGGAFGQVIGPLIAFVCGVSIAAATMNVVSTAVDTIVVCFAEAPAEFEQNHPELSRAMNDAFAAAWPEFDLALDSSEKNSRKGLASQVV